MKKETKLYNALFPLWMILLFPQTWLFVIPGNFVIDSIVLLLAALALKIESKWAFYRSNILKVFAFGFLADIVGAGLLLLVVMFQVGTMGDELYLTLPALLLSAGLIYVFNYCISFRKLDKTLRFKLALTFAVATAPYTFLIPSSWIYGF